METVSDTIVNTLKDLGIKFVFGIPGGNFIHLLSSIKKCDDIEFILVSNESSCGFMADVVFRLTGRMAACFATFGPGACNLTTGVCGGFLDRSPMLVFTDVKSSRMIHRITQMNIDHQELFKPITKLTTRLDIHNIRKQLFKAAEIALKEVPGPVHVGIPEDVTHQLVKNPMDSVFSPDLSIETDDHSLNKAVILLKKSKKPLIVLGNTCNRFHVSKQVKTLSDTFNIPVVLTPMAKGLYPEAEPLYGGVLAHALSDLVYETSREADLILGIGYDPVEINYETWVKDQKIIHIDTRESDPDLKKSHSVTDVTGDLEEILTVLLNSDLPYSKWDKHLIENRKDEIFLKLKSKNGTFGPCEMLTVLREKLPNDSIVTCDVGAHMHLAGQLWKTGKKKSFLMTNGCSSMGFSIPAAIAANLVSPEKISACIIGDGCFLMSCGEIATAVRLNLHIIVIVLSDHHLSLIKHKQEQSCLVPYGTYISEKNIISSNHFLGATVLKSETPEEFENALKESLCEKRVTLIEVTTDASAYTDLILRRA